MRGEGAAAAALAAALVLGCRVDVEGAPCEMPGEVSQCPAGQACGNDLKCSERALACLQTRCVPTTVACREKDVWTCTGADPACGAWSEKTTDCQGQGLECTGATVCVCPVPASVFEVDPAASGTGGLAPTGAGTNPACRFATLGAALAVAGPVASASGSATVRATVATGATPAVFGPAAGDAIPIQVPPGVTLESCDPDHPESWLVSVGDAVPAAGAIVELGDGATLRGFTVQNQLATAPAVASGAGVTCGAVATLDRVRVETNALALGVQLSGGCIATLQDVAVGGARRAGVYVETTGSGTSEIVGGSFTALGNGTAAEPGHGIWVRSGAVYVHAPAGVTFSPLAGTFAAGEPVDLSGSTGSGLRADKDLAGLAIAVTLENARVTGNGAAGIYLYNLPAGSSVSLGHSLVEGNGSTGYYNGRLGGGLVVYSAAVPGITFEANRVVNSVGDQIGLWVPDRPIADGPYQLHGGDSVAASACGDLSSVIAACGTGEDVFSTTSVPVAAELNYWNGNVPKVTGAEPNPICLWVGGMAPACP